MAEKKSEHSGHRDRMRKKYLEYGISIFEQHEILEILLFHVISRKDTNTIAHKLIAEFGSLSNVLDASYNSIAEKGFNDDIAFFLSFLPDFFEVYVQDKFQNKHFILNKYSIHLLLADTDSSKCRHIQRQKHHVHQYCLQILLHKQIFLCQYKL